MAACHPCWPRPVWPPEAGGYSSRSYEELKALASTPLDGLPERASKKPKKRTKAN
jgi:hypothetical protein